MGFMYARMKSEVISIQDYGGVLTSWGVRTWGTYGVYVQGVGTRVYVRCTYRVYVRCMYGVRT